MYTHQSRILRGASCLMLPMLLLAMAGCASHNRRTEVVVDAYCRGDYKGAATAAALYVEKVPNRDKLVALLEQGTVQRAAGQLKESNETLDAADDLFTKFDETAKVRISQQAAATATNLATLDYQGYGYDRIMMNVYKALNCLEQGDLEHARNELKRVAYAQQMSIERYRAKIEHFKKKAGKKHKAHDEPVQTAEDQAVDQSEDAPEDASTGNPTVDGALGNEAIKAQLADRYKGLDDLPDLSDREVYVNPFAEYLQGLFFLYAGDNDDRSLGRTAMRNVGGMGKNPYVEQDVEMAEKVSDGQAIEPTTYVIYEAGLAPMRNQFMVQAVIPTHSGNFIQFKAAFPVLSKIGPEPTHLQATTADGRFETALLADMDRIVTQEFKNELPAVVIRTIISSTVQAAAAYAAREAAYAQARRTDHGEFAALGAWGATVGYQAAVTKADLRTWRTLPKQVQIARFATPKDRVVTLSLSGCACKVELVPGTVNVVYVKAIGAEGRPPLVRQFKLK